MSNSLPMQGGQGWVSFHLGGLGWVFHLKEESTVHGELLFQLIQMIYLLFTSVIIIFTSPREGCSLSGLGDHRRHLRWG